MKNFILALVFLSGCSNTHSHSIEVEKEEGRCKIVGKDYFWNVKLCHFGNDKCYIFIGSEKGGIDCEFGKAKNAK